MTPSYGLGKSKAKNHQLFLGIIAAIALAFAGCGKGHKAPPVALNGVNIDLPRLQQACSSSSAEVRDSLDKVRLSIRYTDYRAALAELGKLGNNPDFSDAQKKTISDVSEQVKQAFANAAPNTAQ